MAEGAALSERDLALLGAYFQALGFPSRLRLLSLLQVPRTAQEIRLAPTRVDRDARSGRAVSRQALTGHLRRLLAIGLVEASPSRRHGRTVTEYSVSHARLFALVEEMRRLALIRPPPSATGVTALQDGPGEASAALLASGPALVMANGPLEGRAFALQGPGPWTIGRLPSCEVCLAHDPFVSKRNTLVRRATPTKAGGPTAPGQPGPPGTAGGSGAAAAPAFLALARPEARNGTAVNWQPMPPGGEAPLANGDVLRVGRTLLVLRGA